MYDPHHPARDTDELREPQQPADPRRWKALAVICVAQFMLILDLTVVNVALPDLGADLDLSRSAFTWTVSAYVLFFGGLLLLGGRFADVFGARPVMLTGVVIFTLASLASGLAQNDILLLGGRVGQGVGAALLSPAALSAITAGFHGEERNKALSVWAASAASASPPGCSSAESSPPAPAGAGSSSSTSRSASSCWPPSRPWYHRAATRTAPPGASTCSAR
jgi:MFS family permease